MKKCINISSVLMLTALLLSSCSEEGEPSVSENRDIIGYNVSVENPKGTRATPITVSNYLSHVSDFNVWGYFNGSTEYYLGRQGSEGITITHTSNKSDWNYKTATDVVLWPKTALNFYAVTPSDNSNYAFNGQSLTYTVPTDQTKQVDLMVAKADNQLKTTNNGKVALQFQHQLSQVTFKGIIKTSDMSVDVKGITIHNVRSNMTIAFAGTATQPTAAYSNYAVGLASAATVNSTTTAISLTDDDGVLMVVPQTLTGWSTTSSTPVPISTADTNHECYLEIECKIKSGDTYIVGSEDGYDKTYVPMDESWEAGKRYVYTLCFGSGKDENGKDMGKRPITFLVSVYGWGDNDGKGNNITL